VVSQTAQIPLMIRFGGFRMASGTDLGFEAELFKAADKLRGNLEPSEYKQGKPESQCPRAGFGDQRPDHRSHKKSQYRRANRRRHGGD